MILIAFNELAGVQGSATHALGALLLFARISHPVGMVAPSQSPLHKPFRAFGVLGTWGVILVAAIMLLGLPNA